MEREPEYVDNPVQDDDTPPPDAPEDTEPDPEVAA